MPQSLVILTGASRGLGAAMADQLLNAGTVMLCLSRGRHPTLATRAAASQAQLEEWPRDLADSITVADEVVRCPRRFAVGGSRVRSTREGDRTDEEALHRGTDHWLSA